MAASLTIEDERGTCARSAHPHNGYYAGDFSGRGEPAVARAINPVRTVSSVDPLVLR